MDCRSVTKKLLFVVNVDWFFLSHRLPIALAAQQQGYQVHIATGLTGRLEELRGHGLVVHSLTLDRSSTSWGEGLCILVQLWRIFRAVQPDVVHLVTLKPVLIGGLLARLLKVPAMVAAVSGLGFVFMAHGVKASLRRRVVGMLYRLALAHRNFKIIFQNPDDLRSLAAVVNFQDDQVALIRGSGVDLEVFHPTPLPNGSPVVVLAARLLVDKGVVEFVQAAHLLKRRGVLARFVLAGMIDRANPTSLSHVEVNAWVEEGVVEWWGHRLDMPQVLAAAQVVVLPSYREGLPKVLLEAAACGRAVVTTNVPGCRDAIEVGVTGLLVPAGDAVALADVLAELVSDRERCETLGAAGRLLAERAFDVRRVVDAHLQIYRELMEKS